MKLNQGKALAVAAALVVGSSIAVVGCAASEDVRDEQGSSEHAQVGTEQAANAESNAGTEKDWYRGGRGWGGRGWGGRGWGWRGGRWGYGPGARRWFW